MSAKVPRGSRALARWGEDLAARFLARRGWRIEARNVRTPYGELDLVAHDGTMWVFVEVKTRRGTGLGWPEEAVTPTKWRRIYHSALHWLEETGQPHDVAWRIDVVAIVVEGGRPQIRHFESVDYGPEALE